MNGRRNLPAAVLREGDKGADQTARVVPVGARAVSLGTAVAGYFHAPHAKRRDNRKLTGWRARAAVRLRELGDLAGHRGRHGVLLPGVPAARWEWLKIVANALAVIGNARDWAKLDEGTLGKHLPPLDRRYVGPATDRELAVVIGTTRGIARFMSDRRAGRLARLTVAEWCAMAADGKAPTTLRPLDTSDAEHAERRAEKRRVADREKKRKRRARLRAQRDAAASHDLHPQNLSVRDACPVTKAVTSGASSLTEIGVHTGQTCAAVRKAAARAVARGWLNRTGRGRYGPAHAADTPADHMGPCRGRPPYGRETAPAGRVSGREETDLPIPKTHDNGSSYD